jgi:DNA-binding SARP family transcriptional activator/tetratricopeptide (TPR) repeat protein
VWDGVCKAIARRRVLLRCDVSLIPPEGVRWTLLGPVRMIAGGRAVDVGTAKQRGVLAALLLTPRQTVPVGTLVDRVWEDQPPRSANAVAPYITRLRRLFDAVQPGQSWLRYGDGGYRIDCEPDQVDLHHGRRLAAEARAAPAEQAAANLLEALRSWQPVALAGIPGHWAGQVRDDLARERLSLYGRWGRAAAEAGRHDEVVQILGPVAAENLTSEALIAPLMIALAGSGRSADALTWYARSRTAIAAELGSEPSPDLRELHLRVLREDPALTAAAPSGPEYRPLIPAQLPADVPGFAGRDTELDRLDRLLDAPAPVIAAVSGPPGVGKTALVTHWAHRIRDRFPDGQLYVNLRGFDPTGRVVAPAQAIRGFLEALGLPPERVPATEDARAAMYRSVVTGKRVLIVLDNARDAGHVRSLLPGTGSALTVVSSRNQLTPLLVADGARPVALDVLSAPEARDLLARRLGADLLDAEPAATEEIIAACARLPLALSIAAARAGESRFPLAALAGELHDTAARLDVLDAGDPITDLRSVFSWSYAALTEPAARLFRLLALHPGPDVSAAVAASLAGASRPDTRRWLTELTRANLLAETTPGRYGFHDLLRAYADGLVREAGDDRRAALARLLDHYHHTAVQVARLLSSPYDEVRAPLPEPLAGVRPESPADEAEANAWFAAEIPSLLAVVALAAETGFDEKTGRIALALDRYLDRRGRWGDVLTMWRAARTSAERLADPVALLAARRGIARTFTSLGRYDDARTELGNALELASSTGNAVEEARVHRHLGYVCAHLGDYEGALAHAERALAVFERTGHPRMQASALNAVGWYLSLLGRHAEALASGEKALAVLQNIGERKGQAFTLDTLGYVHHHLGHHDTAVDRYRQALALFSELGDQYHEAIGHDHLGDVHLEAGDVAEARAAWTRSAGLLTEMGHADAATVRAKLDALG